MRVFFVNRAEVEARGSRGLMFKIYSTPADRLMVKQCRLGTADRFITLIASPQTKVNILVAYCQCIIKTAERLKDIPAG